MAITSDQQVQEYYNQLNQSETQLKQIASESVPQRKFGSGITKDIQSQYIKRKETASKGIVQVETEKKKIEDYYAKQSAYNNEVQAQETAYKAYQKGIQPYWYKGQPEYKYLKEYWKNAGSYDRAVKERQQIQSQYTDALGQGISIAPELAEAQIKKYNDQANTQQSIASDLVTQQKFKQYLTKPQQFDLSNIQQLAMRQQAISKTTEINTYKIPLFTKNTPEVYMNGGKLFGSTFAAQTYYLISEGVRQQGTAIKLTAGEAAASGYLETRQAIDRLLIPSARSKINYPLAYNKAAHIATEEQQKTAFTTAGLTIGLLSPAAPLVEGYFGYELGKSGYKLVKEKSPGAAANFLINAPLALGLLNKAFKLANKPIEVARDLPKVADIKSDTQIYNVKKGDKQVNIASFAILGSKEVRYAYYVPRYERILSELNPFVIGRSPGSKPQTFEELQFKFPNVEKVVIEKPSASIALTEPFVVSNGEIMRPLRNGKRRVYVASMKSNNPSLILSQVTGGLKGEARNLRMLNLNSLDPITKKSFQRMNELFNKEGLKITRNFPKETKLQRGDILLNSQLKIDSKGNVRIVPYGKRTIRSEITSVQVSKGNVEFSREYGMKEFEELKDYLASVDITKPRVPRSKNTNELILTKTKGGIELGYKEILKDMIPKKVDLITGKTTRRFIELPSESEPINFIKLNKPPRTAEQIQKMNEQMYKNDKAILNLKAGASSKIIRDLSNKPISLNNALGIKPISGQSFIIAAPKYTGGTGSKSEFEAKGQYERSDSGSFNRNLFKELSVNKNYESSFIKPLLKENSLFAEKNVNREINREIIRNSPREYNLEVNRELAREIQKITQKEVNKEILKEVHRTPGKITEISLLKLNKPPKSPTTPKPFSINFKLKKSSDNSSYGYRTFIKRFGKIKLLSGVREKGTALRFGENVAKKTLAATFGIKKSNKSIKEIETAYTPDSIFRDYRIKAGKKYKLDNEFIQRLGKRLSSSYEVSAIQRARARYR